MHITSLPLGLLLWLFLSILSCKPSSTPAYIYQKTAISNDGIVISAHPLASEAGREVLKQGGNAIDAAVAVQLVLAVTHPRAGNIGGGGFLLYRNANGTVSALDFREKAPINAHRDMYLDKDGNTIPDLSKEGHLACGVPGTIAGIEAYHQKYGSLSWSEVFQPAIRIARNGHRLSNFEAVRLNGMQQAFIKVNGDQIPFVKETPWKEGDIITHPFLANTLERIAEHGSTEFYRGRTADYIVKEMEQGGGIITHTDLETYQPVWRIPLRTDYRGHKVISMPPPSSGGLALIQLLEIIEPYPLDDWSHRDHRTIHLMIEAERRVFADRATYLGDDDFYNVPTDSLLDSVYLVSRMRDFDLVSASSSQNVQAGKFAINIESYETTHISVVDKAGNVVSLTTTLNTNYGSKVYVDSAGFFLNNEMDDFSVKPGTPNYYGLVGGEANAIAPEKRMLSSMTPTIVEKDGDFFMCLGAPGGSTIITSVLQALLNVIDFDMSAPEAVGAYRFHHQWLPDEVIYEPGCFSDSITSRLETMGHELRQIQVISNVDIVQRLPDGTYIGAADPREGSDVK